MAEWKNRIIRLKRLLGTRNLFLLLLAIGLLLLSVSTGGSRTQKNDQQKTNTIKEEAQTGTDEEKQENAEQRFMDILSGVKGVGKTKVMITYADGGKKQVLKDTKSSTESVNETDGVGGSRVNIRSEQEETTVYESGEQPFVTQETTAKVAGVVVVCEGGGDNTVVLKIVSAAEALFGVAAHRIVVLEMK